MEGNGNTYTNREVHKMEDNPFVGFITKIREDSRANYPTMHRFGRIVSTQPIQVEVDDTIYEESDLLKNDSITNFTVNDNVLLLPIEEEQRYIILLKVVEV